MLDYGKTASWDNLLNKNQESQMNDNSAIQMLSDQDNLDNLENINMGVDQNNDQSMPTQEVEMDNTMSIFYLIALPIKDRTNFKTFMNGLWELDSFNNVLSYLVTSCAQL